MVILQIACIKNSPCNGVCIIVPQYIVNQRKFADVGFMNVNNAKIAALGENIIYQRPFELAKLPKPYDHPDLVVFQETYRREYLKIAAELRKNNVPYITVPHGELSAMAQKKKHLKKMLANALFFNRFTDGAIAIQCLSRVECDNTHFGKRKIITSNSMNIPDVKKENFGIDGIKFLYIGRLDAGQKGLDLMVSAIRLKADLLRDNKCTFKIYGPDWKGRAKRLEELIKKAGVTDLVSLNDEIYGKEKERVLLDSDVFIQTSRFEGMPLGILEAMSYGLPCLVTQGTTLGEKIGKFDAGWSAKTSAESIAQKLEQAVSEKGTFKEKGIRGRKVVETEFSQDKVASETIGIYKKLLSEHKQ